MTDWNAASTRVLISRCVFSGDFKNTRDKYAGAPYPEFDISQEALDIQFHLVIADQVWERLLWPHKATSHVLEVIRHGGHFLVTTLFPMIVHDGRRRD